MDINASTYPAVSFSGGVLPKLGKSHGEIGRPGPALPGRGRFTSFAKGDPIAVTDNTPPDVLTAVVPIAGTTIVITFTEATSPPLLPASSITGFTCLVGGVSRSITAANRSASTEITLTLSSAAFIGETVTLSYSGGNVTDSASPANALASFSNATVTNNSTVDTTAPVELSAAVPSAGTTIVVNITEAGSPPLLPATSITGFTALVNGVSRSISSAARTASTQITLTLAAPVVYIGDTVRISYAPGNVTDSASPANALATFSNAVVTNNSTQATVSTTETTLERGQAGQTIHVQLLGGTATATSDFTLTGSTVTAINATDPANPILTVTAAISTGSKTLTHVATGATTTITVNDTTVPDSPGGLTFSTPPTSTYAFTFSWSAVAPAPSGEAITYTVKKNGVAVSSGQAGTSYAATNVSTGDVFGVVALDTSGNTSTLQTLTFTAPAIGAGGGARLITGGRL